MKDVFYMWPINETGAEKKMLGHRIEGNKYGFSFDFFYTVVDNIRLIVDEITGMVCFAEYNKEDIKDIDKYVVDIFTNAGIKKDINDIHNNCMKEGIILTTCEKKFEFIFTKQNLITKKNLKSREGIAFDIMEKFELNSYFKNVFVHRDFGQQTATSNAILICPVNYVLQYGRNETTVDFLAKNLVKLEEIPNARCLYYPNMHRRGTTDILVNLKIGKYNIGHYVPASNILILSDITSDKEYEWLSGIFAHLKKYYMRKITKSNLTKEFEITMGCDPEFELYNDRGQLLVGEDLNAEGRLQKKIGADGHGRQLELRPEASHIIEEVIDDLTGLFKSVSHLRVDAKGDQEPLGGHIHFGVIGKKNPAMITYSQTVVDALDIFIGRHTIKMNGKARGQYGKLGDVRNQPWGFEYRVAPAAVFATKEMAYITLKLAKNIVEALLERDIKCSYPLSKEDLTDFLTPEEAEYYLNFPETFKTLKSDDIIQYWTVERNKPIELRFYDKWSKTVKNDFTRLLKDTIIDSKTVVCLYGVKGDYGAGVEVYGKSIPHPHGVHCTEGIAIGLPRVTRTEGSCMRDVCSEIKRKIGQVNGAISERTTENMFPEEMIGCAVGEHSVDIEELF